MMTYWYPAVADTIALIRRYADRIPIGLGGVYARLMPQHAGRVCRPDKLFTGGSLNAVREWLDELVGIKRRAASAASDFHSWPAPAYDLYHQLDYLTLLTSLGCPFRCDYCASGILQPHLQQLPTETFIAQLEQLVSLVTPHDGHCNIALMDDAHPRPTHRLPNVSGIQEPRNGTQSFAELRSKPRSPY